MKKDITELFVCLDDFCKIYDEALQSKAIPGSARAYKTRVPGLAISEIMSILLLFQRSSCTNFKHFYWLYMPLYKHNFPKLCHDNRFVQIIHRALAPLSLFFNFLSSQSEKTGWYFIDSTKIPVCHNKRIKRNKVFSDSAAIGKSTMGWFFGFKLHIIINHKGEIMAARLTPGNTDDRKPMPELVNALKGLIFGDKGYISAPLFHELFEKGLKLVTPLKSNMKQALLPIEEKILLRKRSLIETVNGCLKQHGKIEHTRHRSFCNFLVHICASLIHYSLKSQKPSISSSAS